ncbi:MAG TPA: ABC transporter permease [Candidatus Binatia bacterium]|jgi:ABC-type nitrate/sulfonate/bicarbonate transport system permease component
MKSKRVNLAGLAVFAALLLLWELSSRSSPDLKSYFPPPSEVLSVLFRLAFARELFGHFVDTLARFLGGYFLAATIAISLGVVLGYSRFAHSLFDPLIELLRPMPSVAIIPVAILLLGIDDAMMIGVTVYACAWPILLNTIDGVRSIDRTLIDTGRTFGLGRWRILREIALPAASPYIATGLRVSLPIALILVTTSEMVVGSSGLGYFILDEERSFRTKEMYAGIVVVALLGYVLNRLFVALENRAIAWHRGSTIQGMP